jgi:NAD(P)-dependent dehydrogenase (short-subunit alcohol dehydrogenase family)
MKTVLITGASSGIGLETALYFFERNWNVIATMRNPQNRRTVLHDKGLPDLVHLDVMDASSIHAAIQYATEKYIGIDVLVNNAGYAVYGPFEATTPDQVKRQYDTNVFGLMQVTREILPLFRQQKSGVIINVSSMGGRAGFPLYSIYDSTKWAVEGFSEILLYELKPLNIQVKLIEPGVIKTDFYDRSLDPVKNEGWSTAYGNIMKRGERFAGEKALRFSSSPRVVARTIYRAAHDPSSRLRYTTGMGAKLLVLVRWLLPERLFFWIMEKVML